MAARYFYGLDSHNFIRRVLFNDYHPTDDEFTWVEAPEPVNDQAATSETLFRLESGVITETDIPIVMPEHCDWDDDNGCWKDVRDLNGHKASKWDEIKSARSSEEAGSFVWNDHTFDCDEVSQRRIQGAVQLAQLDSSTTLTWTLADNTTQTFNATELQQIGQALAAHVDACHVKARGLRASIDAAQNEAELSVISW